MNPRISNFPLLPFIIWNQCLLLDVVKRHFGPRCLLYTGTDRHAYTHKHVHTHKHTHPFQAFAGKPAPLH